MFIASLSVILSEKFTIPLLVSPPAYLSTKNLNFHFFFTACVFLSIQFFITWIC